MEHTHLVKGLDFALLNKVNRLQGSGRPHLDPLIEAARIRFEAKLSRLRKETTTTTMKNGAFLTNAIAPL